jgi:alpha-galactosidase
MLPGFGNGLGHAPALRAHRDGAHAVQDLVCRSYEKSDVDGVQTLVLHLGDATVNADVGLEATMTLTMHQATDLLSIRTSVRNTGTQAVQLDWLAAGAVPISAPLTELGSFSGQWAHEFQWQRGTVPMAGWQQKNRHGRTSHEAPPACFLMTPQADDQTGEVIAAQLAWSGNHAFGLDRNDDGSFLLQAGEWLAPGEVRLAAGESASSPAMHVTWSDQGLNGASGNFHQFARRHVVRWPNANMAPRPVHLNTWEAVYFNHDDATLRELAVQAAAIGVERFVLDDGWFPGRPDDHSGLGDWWPDPVKYPQGLTPLIEHVLGLGMAFGLWVEPEMVNPDSELYRQHPDWALQSSGRIPQLGRNQLVLDISRREVSDYLFEKLNALLSGNAISYLKWDMNRDLAQAEDAQGRMAYGRQVKALYQLLARVREAFPLVEIESCASGAGRMDLGVLQHTQRFWTSDNNDALSRVTIQGGAMRLFPLEVLGAHVGPAPAHSTGRAQSIDFRCAVALFGHMGVEADVRKLEAAERASLARWIALYKEWRGVLHSGKFHQGTTVNGVWWLVHTPRRCILGVYTTQAPSSQHHAPLRLPMLAGDGDWRLRLIGRAGLERARGQVDTGWLEELQSQGLELSASELRVLGLPLLNMNPESALIFSLESEVV